METRRRSILNEAKDKKGKLRNANWELLKDLIQSADVVLEILDARDIAGTRLQDAERWAGSNRLLLVVNKCDLIPENSKKPVLPESTIFISAKDRSKDTRKILLDSIVARARKLPARGVIVGYPNVGKSSIINLLAKKEAAKVSPIAGTTTHVQWVRVSDDVIINDYPGVFPAYEEKEGLVRKGALNISKDADPYAHQFARKILFKPLLREWFEKKFDLSIKGAKNSEELLVIFAKRRGWLLKGGEPNLDQASKALVRALKEAPEL